jgi:hypothetical protein
MTVSLVWKVKVWMIYFSLWNTTCTEQFYYIIGGCLKRYLILRTQCLWRKEGATMPLLFIWKWDKFLKGGSSGPITSLPQFCPCLNSEPFSIVFCSSFWKKLLLMSLFYVKQCLVVMVILYSRSIPLQNVWFLKFL